MLTMTKKKTIGSTLAIWGIVFLVYNLLVFLFLTPRTPVFWISYGFMFVSFVLQLVGLYLSFKDFSVQAVFFGIPLAQFTLFYFFSEVFVSLVFMIFQNITWKIPLFLQILLLAVYGVVAIVSVMTRDAAVTIKDSYTEDARVRKTNTVDVELLQDMVADPELKTQLHRLAEAIRYSDPRGNDAVADVDAQILQESFALQTYCEDGDTDSAKASCAKMMRLYVARNKKLLASK